TLSMPAIRKKGQRRSSSSGAMSSQTSEVLGASFLDASPTAKCPMNMGRHSARFPGFMQPLRSLTLAELGEWVQRALGEKRFRADQIFRWLHGRRAHS